MGENTKIEWSDHTFNPWLGCSKVADGCAHCYAETISHQYQKAKWGPNGTRVMTGEVYWQKPLKWNREAERQGVRKRVFCASMADVFEEWGGPILNSLGQELWECANCDFTVGYDPLRSLKQQGLEKDACSCSRGLELVPLGMVAVRKRLFKLIDATPWLDWILVTKRPENIFRMWPENIAAWEQFIGKRDLSENTSKFFRSNVWLLTSVATQEDADRNIPLLLKCRDLAPVLGISAEPLLGPIVLDTLGRAGPPRWLVGEVDHNDPTLDWVIVGGESGPHASPMNPQWAQSIRDQCQAAGVPFHFKQWGEWAAEMQGGWTSDAPQSDAFVQIVDYPEGKDYTGSYMARVGKKVAGRILDGRTWDEFPEVRR